MTLWKTSDGVSLDALAEEASPADLLAVVRRGVESGTIKLDYDAAVRRLAKIHQSWATQAESCRPSRPCYGCRLRAHRAIEAALGLPESSATEHHRASMERSIPVSDGGSET